MLLNFHLIITFEREGKRERPTDKVRMRHQDESKVRKKSHNNLQTDVPFPLSSYPTMPSGHSAENLNTYIADRRQKLSRWGFIRKNRGEKKAQETQIKRRPEQEKKKTKKKKEKFHQFRCQVELNLLRAEQLGYLAAIDFREQNETEPKLQHGLGPCHKSQESQTQSLTSYAPCLTFQPFAQAARGVVRHHQHQHRHRHRHRHTHPHPHWRHIP